MANSRYEYVKYFEMEDVIIPPNIIVVRIDGRDFRRFSEVHEFNRPNDAKALELMDECATSVLNSYPDIVFCYGFNDEYSFMFKKTTRFYQRRASKALSLIVSLFASIYVTKWKDFFPEKEIRCPPSFHGQVIPCASIEVLQEYLAWRQNLCHATNLYNTCLWNLVSSGKSKKEAQEFLQNTKKQEKNELLHKEFEINYKNQPEIFRQGSCIIKRTAEDIVKYLKDGTPVKRLRSKAERLHSKNIAATSFWNGKPNLVGELGSFVEDIGKPNPDYVRSFSLGNKLLPSTWIIIRIDGCHFHRFSDDHEFEKPNDKQALDLMSSCAEAVLQEFRDIIFAYGVSDEYSFVLQKESQLHQRLSSDIVSVIVSFFSSMYVMKWKDFFMRKELKYPPSFDGRAVCYPSSEILRDYLAWRQVDCHINCQYNTCFWILVKSGKSRSESQKALKGMQTREKNELLKQFGIDYNTLPDIFRQGSSVFWKDVLKENGAMVEKLQKLATEHCNIIEDAFWRSNPSILN